LFWGFFLKTGKKAEKRGVPKRGRERRLTLSKSKTMFQKRKKYDD